MDEKTVAVHAGRVCTADYTILRDHLRKVLVQQNMLQRIAEPE